MTDLEKWGELEIDFMVEQNQAMIVNITAGDPQDDI